MNMKTLFKRAVPLFLLLTVVTSMAIAVDYGAENPPEKEYTQTFADVSPNHWAFKYIAEMVERGVVNGYPDGTFKPTNLVRRDEFAKIMVGASGVPLKPTSVSSFADVNATNWCSPYVEAAKNYLNAYTGPNGELLFKPAQVALREDITVAVVKMKGYDTRYADESILDAMFSDVNSISTGARKYVAIAVENGLITGFNDGTFRGQASLSRAEAIAILWRAYQYGDDSKIYDDLPDVTPTPTTPPAPTPTFVPTASPAPIPEPTPAAKPYVVDTLVKVNIADVFNYTYDGIDTVYYVENGIIYRLNIKTKAKTMYYDTADLIINTEEMSLSNFSITGLCFDKNQKRLLVTGEYKNINSAQIVSKDYLYEISGNMATVLCDNFYFTMYAGQDIRGLGKYNIVGVMNNGNLLTGYNYFHEYGWIIDLDKIDSYNTYHNPSYYAWYAPDDVIETNGKLYYRLSYDNSFYCYDFTDPKELWRIPVYSMASGLTSSTVVVASNNATIYTYNYSGKELSRITPEDYDVADMNAVNFATILNKIIVTDDNSIVFYDKNARAFRILKNV